MEDGILKSTKKILNISDTYLVFDPDILTHINSTFIVIQQLGIGPIDGITIEEDTTWSSLEIPLTQLNLLKTYVYLKVRMLFDPPSTSFQIEAMNNQIAEHEHRLSFSREELIPIPVDPVEEVEPSW